MMIVGILPIGAVNSIIVIFSIVIMVQLALGRAMICERYLIK